jgi:hypothetical protein
MQKNLTFEQRTQRIEAWLSDFIELLDAPFAIRQDSNKQGRELSDIVEALNGCITSQINAEQFNSILDRIRKSLRASQDTRTWPTIKAFTKAAGEAATRKDITETNRVVAFDRHEIAARRIHAGESVGQSYIWGRDAAILEADGKVTEQQLEQYRQAIFTNICDLHGEKYAQKVIQELDQSHMISALDLAEERASPSTTRKARKTIEDIITEAANK